MSINTAMTSIADRIRGLLGLTGTMGLDAIASNLAVEQVNISDAFAAVSSNGGTVPDSQVSGNLAAAIGTIPTGATVQRESGTFTTDTGGNSIVECGFQPDLVYLQFGADKDGFIFSAAVAFAEETRSGTNNVCSWGDALGDNIAFVDINMWQSEQGFSVNIDFIAFDWGRIDADNAQISYTAVKYT